MLARYNSALSVCRRVKPSSRRVEDASYEEHAGLQAATSSRVPDPEDDAVHKPIGGRSLPGRPHESNMLDLRCD